MPSYVTRRPDAAGRRTHRSGNPRTHERQYLPLRGLSEHRRRHQASRGNADMKAFTYQRADTTAARRRRCASKPGAKFIAGGTNLLDLMKLQVETPAHAGRYQPAAARQHRRRRRMAGLRIGALVRNSDLAADPRVRQRYPRAEPRVTCRRQRAVAQQGAPPAAICCSGHAAIISMTPTKPCNKRNPGSRLFGDRRLQPHPCRPGHQRPMHRDASRPTWRWRCGRSTPRWRRSKAEGERASFRSPTSSPCRATRREIESVAQVRRAHHGGDAAAAATGHAGLSQGARPRLLRLCAGFGRGDRRSCRRQDPFGPARLRRSRAQALARCGRPRRNWPAPPPTQPASARPEMRCSKAPAATAATISRSR